VVNRDILAYSSSQGKTSQFFTFECDVAFGCSSSVWGSSRTLPTMWGVLS